VFVRILLPFGEFEGLEQLLHIVERRLECPNDFISLLDCLLDGPGFRGTPLLPLRTALDFVG